MRLIILIRQGRWPGNGRLTGWMTSHTVLTGRQRQTQRWQLSDGPSRQIQFHWPAAVRPWKGLEMGQPHNDMSSSGSVMACYEYEKVNYMLGQDEPSASIIVFSGHRTGTQRFSYR